MWLLLQVQIFSSSSIDPVPEVAANALDQDQDYEEVPRLGNWTLMIPHEMTPEQRERLIARREEEYQRILRLVEGRSEPWPTQTGVILRRRLIERTLVPGDHEMPTAMTPEEYVVPDVYPLSKMASRSRSQ